MRVLYGVKDDLHDYAQTIKAHLDAILHAHVIHSLSTFRSFSGTVLNRCGRMQAELIRMPPYRTLPIHCHPNVDSIDVGIDGDADVIIGGKIIGEGHDPERRAKLLQNVGMRIAKDVWHGGSTGYRGFTFMSIQRWDCEPSHIGHDWNGSPADPLHAQVLASLRKVT